MTEFFLSWRSDGGLAKTADQRFVLGRWEDARPVFLVPSQIEQGASWFTTNAKEKRHDIGAKTLLGVGLSLILASCAGLSTTSVPDTGFAPGAVVEATMAAYYRDHAVEYDVGPCNRPYFDAITKVEVIEEDGKHLVLGLRYAFRDRLRDDEDSNNIPPSSRRVCRGFESRQFTLAKDGGAVRVIEMTGPTRGASSPQSHVILGGRVGVGIRSRLGNGN